jgi:hypothetical protein
VSKFPAYKPPACKKSFSHIIFYQKIFTKAIFIKFYSVFQKKINSFSGEEKNIIFYKIRRGGKYKWMEGNFGYYISLC